MTPFASVAMLEKLALLKIALCRAPAFSSTSSAWLYTAFSMLSESPIRVLVLQRPRRFLPQTYDRQNCTSNKVLARSRIRSVRNVRLAHPFRLSAAARFCSALMRSSRIIGSNNCAFGGSRGAAVDAEDSKQRGQMNFDCSFAEP